MNLKNVLNVLKPIGDTVKKHERGLLTCLTIGAEIYAIYRAAKDGPKYKEILETMPEDATFFDKAKALAPAAAPAIVAGTVSIASSALMYRECGETIRGLADAAYVAKVAKEEFVEHTEKVVGPEKTKEIHESIAAGRAPAVSAVGIDSVIVTGHGNDLFLDDWSGRYFFSDINFIKKTVNDLNYQLMNEMSISLNEYYAYLGIPSIGSGREFGWYMDYGKMIEIDIDSGLTESDKPFTIISFKNMPLWKYGERRW